MSSWYDELGVRTTEDILTEMSDTLKPLTEEDILKMNVKELQKQLNEAHTKIHQLHDIINEMHSLSQKSIDNLIKSVNTGYSRWELDKKMGKVKSWMMDMEEQVDDAISSGRANSEDAVLEYVQNNMEIVDKTFVREYAKKRLGVPKNGYNVWD